jgi:hypothetical protein
MGEHGQEFIASASFNRPGGLLSLSPGRRISRLSYLSDTPDSTGTLESYSYLGLDTVVQRSQMHNNVAVATLSYVIPNGNPDGGDQYTGLDRFGRVVEQQWVNGMSAVTDDFRYTYDQDSNEEVGDADVPLRDAWGEPVVLLDFVEKLADSRRVAALQLRERLLDDLAIAAAVRAGRQVVEPLLAGDVGHAGFERALRHLVEDEKRLAVGAEPLQVKLRDVMLVFDSLHSRALPTPVAVTPRACGLSSSSPRRP